MAYQPTVPATPHSTPVDLALPIIDNQGTGLPSKGEFFIALIIDNQLRVILNFNGGFSGPSVDVNWVFWGAWNGNWWWWWRMGTGKVEGLVEVQERPVVPVCCGSSGNASIVVVTSSW